MYVHSYVMYNTFYHINELTDYVCVVYTYNVNYMSVSNMYKIPICCEAENATNIGVCIQFPTPKIEYRWK